MGGQTGRQTEMKKGGGVQKVESDTNATTSQRGGRQCLPVYNVECALIKS